MKSLTGSYSGRTGLIGSYSGMTGIQVLRVVRPYRDDRPYRYSGITGLTGSYSGMTGLTGSQR
jgi:hypothetical protein